MRHTRALINKDIVPWCYLHSELEEDQEGMLSRYFFLSRQNASTIIVVIFSRTHRVRWLRQDANTIIVVIFSRTHRVRWLIFKYNSYLNCIDASLTYVVRFNYDALVK